MKSSDTDHSPVILNLAQVIHSVSRGFLQWVEILCDDMGSSSLTGRGHFLKRQNRSKKEKSENYGKIPGMT